MGMTHSVRDLPPERRPLFDRDLRYQSDGSAAEAYEDRNLAVQALAARWLLGGDTVGIRDRDSEWPILVAEVAIGWQLSWHIPRSDFVDLDAWPDFDKEWDGHTRDEKNETLRKKIASTLAAFRYIKPGSLKEPIGGKTQ
jgi:hypothetical protein